MSTTSESSVALLADESSLAAWLLTDAAALHVLFVFAEFHAPSKPGGQMDTVVNTLGSIHPTVKFAKLDAEGASDVAEQFDISAVPTFLFFKVRYCLRMPSRAGVPYIFYAGQGNH